MDYNGMTEEEYLDSLLKQASDDIPTENTAEPVIEEPEAGAEPVMLEIEDEAEKEAVDQEAVFDFDDIFGALAEAEEASAESVSEEVKQSEETEQPKEVEWPEEIKQPEEVEWPEETEQPEKVEQPYETEPKEEQQDFSDFHRSLDAIIGELEKEREDNDSGEPDIFNQIDATELSEEELSQDIDDMSLLEAVGMLLDEKEKANEKTLDFDGLFDLDEEIPEKDMDEPAKKPEKEKTKKSFFKKFKAFLIEQGEDTEEDIAAEKAAALAKEEKEKKSEEDKEKKAEEKAAKKEKAEQDKAAKKAEKEGKALERQMKKEQKKAEQEASGEPKYNVTTIKLALLFTIVAAFGILLWAISSFNFRRIAKKEAMIYFTADQYELAYEKIAGLEPRKSDEVFFEQVRTVMYIQKQYDSYLNFYNIGMKEEALNSLLKGIDKYDKYYETADDLGILDDMDKVLEKIYTALEEMYSLSHEKADAIANIEDYAEYSVELRKVINSIKE